MTVHKTPLAPMAVVAAAFFLEAQSGPPPYLDPAQPVETRITDLISRMTLEEKAAELNHLSSRNDRLHIPAWGGWNQTLHGVWSKQPTTLFPTAIGMAATWDPALIRTITDAMSDEARALYNIGADGPRSKHGLVYRSPVINISRDPRWGRIQECFGEDPYLAGRTAVAYVQGLQGNGKYLKVAATVKHFAVNNVETNRHALSAVVPERILLEYWLPHWKAAIQEGRAQSVMASYNQLNGVPNIANHYLLTDILRGLWHFDGFVVSDLGGINSSLVQGSRITDKVEIAAARAIEAGCDLDDNFYEQSLPGAVRSGLISEAVVDQALRRVLRVAFRLGVFEPPDMIPFTKIGADVIDSGTHRQLALKTAQESVVLLRNANNTLPLDRNRIKSVAVIGPQADRFETGNYFGAKPRIVNPLEGIRAKLGTTAQVAYVAGCDILEPAKPEDIDQAVALAGKSDVAILFLGTNLKVEGEGYLIDTPRGTLEADRVLIAAGGWAAEIGAMLGVPIPVRGAPLQMVVTEPAPPLLPCLIAHADRHLTMKQTAASTILIGGAWTARTGHDGHPLVLPESLEGNLWVAARTVPAVAGLGVVRSWAAMNVDIDGAPLLGQVPGHPRVAVAATANGYTLGPLIAREVVRLVLDGAVRDDLKAFGFGRFRDLN